MLGMDQKKTVSRHLKIGEFQQVSLFFILITILQEFFCLQHRKKNKIKQTEKTPVSWIWTVLTKWSSPVITRCKALLRLPGCKNFSGPSRNEPLWNLSLRFFNMIQFTNRRRPVKNNLHNVKCTLNHRAKSAYLLRVTARSVEQNIHLWHVWSFSQLKHRVNNTQCLPSDVQELDFWKEIHTNNLPRNYLFTSLAIPLPPAKAARTENLHADFANLRRSLSNQNVG